MTEKIECPNCGNSEEFHEDVLGLDLTEEFQWDEKQQIYIRKETHHWQQQESSLRCVGCDQVLPCELYEKFLEEFVYEQGGRNG